MPTVRIGQGAIDVSATAETSWEAHQAAMRLFRVAARRVYALEAARREEMRYDEAIARWEDGKAIRELCGYNTRDA